MTGKRIVDYAGSCPRGRTVNLNNEWTTEGLDINVDNDWEGKSNGKPSLTNTHCDPNPELFLNDLLVPGLRCISFSLLEGDAAGTMVLELGKSLPPEPGDIYEHMTLLISGSSGITFEVCGKDLRIRKVDFGVAEDDLLMSIYCHFTVSDVYWRARYN